jgi:hypothetical protein
MPARSQRIAPAAVVLLPSKAAYIPAKADLGAASGMLKSLVDIKKFAYRRIKYALRRPRPPLLDPPFTGPVVVVGSAPVSHQPAGFDETYRIISVNASQVVIDAWGIPAPDVTLMGYNEIIGTATSAAEARRVLGGRRTGALYVLAWRHGLDRLKTGLKAFDYDCRDLHTVDRYERIALMHKVGGILNLELNAETKCSNGLIAVLFALHNGAKAVIITGINPHSAGHAYNGINLVRKHVQMDSEMLKRLVGLGCPIYTADPEVSENVGLPIWKGSADQRDERRKRY